MEDIFKIIFGVTASISITGGVILFIIKIAVEKIAAALEKEYTLKFDKEIEKYKSKLDDRNYITKKQFDLEIDIYRNLSHDFFGMLISFESVYTVSYGLDENYHITKTIEDVERVIKPAICDLTRAQDNLIENRAFIAKELFEKYNEILTKVLDMSWEYINEIKKISPNGKIPDETIRNKAWNDEREKQLENLMEKLEELNDELREYLHGLTIID